MINALHTISILLLGVGLIFNGLAVRRLIGTINTYGETLRILVLYMVAVKP